MCEKQQSYNFLLDPSRIGEPVVFPEFPELKARIVNVSTLPKNFSVTLTVNGRDIILNENNREHEIMIDHHSFYVENSFIDTMTNVSGLPRLRAVPLNYLVFTVCRFRNENLPCVVDDSLALQVEALWKKAFPDATLLPVVGLPSNNKGVLTLVHSDGSGQMLKINGLESKSFLSNNALYSAECSQNKFINLYEVMLPEIPGLNGEESTSQFYTNQLRDKGLTVAGTHFHWFGSSIAPVSLKRIDRGITAVHHQSTTNLDPLEFSRLTIEALQATMNLIKKYSGK